MNREQLADELDRSIDIWMRASAPAKPEKPDSLLQIAAELCLLPSEDFRASLREELMEHAEALRGACIPPRDVDNFLHLNGESAPSFSAGQFTLLPADPRSLFFSFLSHVAVVALIASGVWVSQVTLVEKRPLLSQLTYAPLPSGDTAPHGGGSGGDHSLAQATRGTPPRFSDTQFAPPAIVVPNEKPKLPADATVLGPPDLKLPQSRQIGDLFSPNTVIPSNGTGGPSGMGNNSGTGIGPGNGAGVGPGSRAGYGNDVYRPGRGITAPRAIFNPDPEYSDEARRVKYQGNVVLSLIVDPSGNVREIHVARSLGMGLDEKAIEAVQRWRFAPGMKDGHPVAVQVNVEVTFRLY